VNRLDRLRWIPMLVKAYSDARLRRELESREQAGTESGSRASTANATSQPPQKTHKKVVPKRSPLSIQSASARSSPLTARAVVRRRRQATPGQAVTSVKAGQVQRAVTQQRSTVPVPKNEYKTMLQDLRDTKRKLTRLESSHAQLTQMQQNLDKRLGDLMERLDAPRETAPTAKPLRLQEPDGTFHGE